VTAVRRSPSRQKRETGQRRARSIHELLPHRRRPPSLAVTWMIVVLLKTCSQCLGQDPMNRIMRKVLSILVYEEFNARFAAGSYDQFIAYDDRQTQL
jgi:hypothetical protein